MLGVRAAHDGDVAAARDRRVPLSGGGGTGGGGGGGGGGGSIGGNGGGSGGGVGLTRRVRGSGTAHAAPRQAERHTRTVGRMLIGGVGSLVLALVLGLFLASTIETVHEQHADVEYTRCAVLSVALPRCAVVDTADCALVLAVSLVARGGARDGATATSLLPLAHGEPRCASIAACVEQYRLFGAHVPCLVSVSDPVRIHLAEYDERYSDDAEESSLAAARAQLARAPLRAGALIATVPALVALGVYLLLSGLSGAHIEGVERGIDRLFTPALRERRRLDD